MLLALARRYAAFLRASDGTLAAIGLAGPRDARDVRGQEPDRRLHDPSDEQEFWRSPRCSSATASAGTQWRNEGQATHFKAL